MSLSDLTERVTRYESGEMEEDEIVAFFQYLIDTGMVWNLQGSYGRTATDLINEGLCEPAQ
jgi:hypothetical protein